MTTKDKEKIKVPELGESVTDATVGTWYKEVGDAVYLGDKLLDLETEKIVLEVPSEITGYLVNIFYEKGAKVEKDEVLGTLKESEITADNSSDTSSVNTDSGSSTTPEEEAPKGKLARLFSGPSARRAAKSNDMSLEGVKGTGKAGRVTREDVNKHLSQSEKKQNKAVALGEEGSRHLVERVPMTRLRAKIAERLVMAQQQAAILTTFNEVNLKNVMEIRSRYKERFEKQHGVRLGFMSFFTKAAIEALKQYPIVNASIENNDILYHHYYDIGIAVSTERGLVVPVIRNADMLGFGQIEKSITDYGNKAREGQINIDELTGGTFTITNGGVFGSLLSTPIINPPQSAILGMHKIEERPVVEGGQVVVRPMMYLALSYDHRIIDGKESVQFLATIKTLLEDPTRLLLDI